MKFGLIAFLFFALIIQCFAQSDSSQTQTEQTIENLLEEPGEETDNSDLYNLIEYYMDQSGKFKHCITGGIKRTTLFRHLNSQNNNRSQEKIWKLFLYE